jgi:WXXGXW repeat (2 copies)
MTKGFRRYGLAGTLLGLMLLAGCAGGHYYAGITYGPPAPIIEQPYGVAPGPYYVWTPGYYEWFGGTWVWRRGTWRRRPHPIDRWVAPRWERRGNRYRYYAGGWQHGHHVHR